MQKNPLKFHPPGRGPWREGGDRSMKFRWEKKYLYWGVTALLVIIGGISFYYLLFHGGSFRSNLLALLDIAAPIIDGIVLAYLMWPILHFIEQRLLYPVRDALIRRFPGLASSKRRLTRVCRGVGILITLVFVTFLIYGFFQVVIPQIIASVSSIIRQLPEYFRNLTNWLDMILSSNPDLEKAAGDMVTTYSGSFYDWLNNTLIPQMNTLLRTVSVSMINLAKFLWDLVIGLIISIYLLASKERFLSQAKKMVYALLDTNRANALTDNARLIDRTFGGFISGKLLDSFLIGVIAFISVSLLGFPYPMLLSFIIGVTNIIPFFGPFIGAVPCALLILMVNPMQALYFVIFIFVLQQFDGNILGPRILGNSTGLTGFWVIFSITLFSGLMGVAGMILGVPVFAVFYTLVRRKINGNLKRKGMPVETEAYTDLMKVDRKTGRLIPFAEGEEGRGHWRQKINHTLSAGEKESAVSVGSKESMPSAEKEGKPSAGRTPSAGSKQSMPPAGQKESALPAGSKERKAGKGPSAKPDTELGKQRGKLPEGQPGGPEKRR